MVAKLEIHHSIVIDCIVCINPIRSRVFEKANDPGGGGFKSPLQSQKLLYQSSPYQACAFA